MNYLENYRCEKIDKKVNHSLNTVYKMKQEIELKEGMTARIEGGKVIIETPEFCPKDGDFVAWETPKERGVCILRGEYNGSNHCLNHYVDFSITFNDLEYGSHVGTIGGRTDRSATDSEKQTLLDALARDGKRWNAEMKCVEPLRCRAEIGERYYYIVVHAGEAYIGCNIENNDEADDVLFELGNYFRPDAEVPVKAFQKMYAEFFANYKNKTK
jgi:hypothetical protein